MGAQAATASMRSSARAIVQIAPAASTQPAALRPHGLRIDRALMPSIGLWRVRDPVDASPARARRTPRWQRLRWRCRPYLERARAHQRCRRTTRGTQGSGSCGEHRDRAGVAAGDGDRATTVVVVDNGCEGDVPDLRANILPGAT